MRAKKSRLRSSILLLARPCTNEMVDSTFNRSNSMDVVSTSLAALSGDEMAMIHGGGDGEVIGIVLDFVFAAFEAGYKWGYEVLGPALFG